MVNVISAAKMTEETKEEIEKIDYILRIVGNTTKEIGYNLLTSKHIKEPEHRQFCCARLNVEGAKRSLVVGKVPFDPNKIPQGRSQSLEKFESTIKDVARTLDLSVHKEHKMFKKTKIYSFEGQEIVIIQKSCEKDSKNHNYNIVVVGPINGKVVELARVIDAIMQAYCGDKP